MHAVCGSFDDKVCLTLKCNFKTDTHTGNHINQDKAIPISSVLPRPF